jgi:hypothetical protein
MATFNIFTGHPPLTVAYDQNLPQPLTPKDTPYFFIIYEGTQTIDPPKPIGDPIDTSSSGSPYQFTWGKVTPTEEKEKEQEQEIDFLDMFGLVARFGTNAYIHPYAQMFYMTESDYTDTAKQAPYLAEVKQLMTNYVLPGRYWRTRHALAVRDPATDPVTHLAKELAKIGDLMEQNPATS